MAIDSLRVILNLVYDVDLVGRAQESLESNKNKAVLVRRVAASPRLRTDVE
jgi:hypothetical protein